jgi:uncharacterized membrane protein YhaH (DUF805 family)
MANRIGRLEYLTWNVVLLCGVLLAVTMAFFYGGRITHHVTELAVLVYAYFKLAVLIPKRLHDMNDSGWWTLLFLLPLIDAGFELVLLFKPGTRDANKYGPVPRTWLREKRASG